MRMRVRDLGPGVVLRSLLQHEYDSVVLVNMPHPLHVGMNLLITWVVRDKRVSFQTLSPVMELGHYFDFVRRSDVDLKRALDAAAERSDWPSNV